MKVHPVFIAAFLTAWFSIQAWQLAEISALRVNVATLTTRLDYLTGTAPLTRK